MVWNTNTTWSITVALLVSRVYPTFRATRPTTGQPVYPTVESSLLSPLHFSPSIQSKCTLPRNTNGSMNPSSFLWASNTVTVIFCPKTWILQFYVDCTKKVLTHVQVCLCSNLLSKLYKLVNEKILLFCSRHKIVKTKFNFQKLSYFDSVN